jgi:hypothetical protein
MCEIAIERDVRHSRDVRAIRRAELQVDWTVRPML